MPARHSHPRDQWEPIAIRLEELKGVLPSLAGLPPVCPENAAELLSRLAGELEHLRRRGIRDQIQAAGMQEVAESLTHVRDPRKVLETLVQYLRRVFDLQEILLIRRHPGSGAAAGFRLEAKSPRVEQRCPMSWRREWSDPILLNRAVGGKTLEGVADLPADPWDPSAYRVIMPLGRNPLPSLPGAPSQPGPLGLLCMTLPVRDTLDEDSRPAEIARHVEMVLEHLRHREDLQYEADYRSQLLQGMRDGLLALDGEGRIVEVNSAAARLLESDAAYLKDRRISDLSGKLPALAACLARAMKDSSDPESIEIQVGSCGRKTPLNVAVSCLRGEDGRFSGLVVNLTDLSAVRAMEAEIRRLDRLAALGRFSAGVAHEIRNPLSGIEAGVTYLSGRIPPDAPEQEDFRFLRTEIRRLNRIITELLDYARPRSLDLCRSEANRLVDRIEQLLAPLLRDRRISILREGPEKMLFWADPERITQVMLNLVKNAAEASPEGGTVRICWETTRPAAGRGAGRDHGPAESGDPGEGLVARFRVIDQGDGMGPEEQSRAFEPFYTTKSAGGTGLGLSVSHAIAEQHGGRLLLESSRGSGTTAVLELPARPQHEGELDAVVNAHSR